MWYVDPDEAVDFLWADKLANRLKDKAAELGVDVLACVTSHWMCDDDTLYLYGWWPPNQTPRVIAFSTAGFDEITPEGSSPIERSPTRWCRGWRDSSAAGQPRTRQERLSARLQPRAVDEYVAGRLKFDPGCRRKLRNSWVRSSRRSRSC